MIKCDICGFDIVGGSVLQPLFAQLILCMVHSLVPFDILDPDTYAEYYNEYIGSNFINIQKPTMFDADNDHMMYTDDDNNADELKNNDCEDRTFYKTNPNKIWNQIYFLLFCKLLGSHKTTRYQHMLAFTSELYCLNAFELKSTPRALYGTDAGEHFNDKVKSCVHAMTNRFASGSGISNLPSLTIDTVMNHCLWDYYNVREQNEKTNCKYIQTMLKSKHVEVDMATLQRPVKIIEYFKKNQVKYKLHIETFDEITNKYNEEYKLRFIDSIDNNDNSNLHYDSEQTERTAFQWYLSNNLREVQGFLDRMKAADLYYIDDHETEEDVAMCMYNYNLLLFIIIYIYIYICFCLLFD